jgi:hypothetical protein
VIDAGKLIQDTLGYLSDQLSRAWLAFALAKAINQAYQDGRLTCGLYLWSTTYWTCTESAVLGLCRLALRDADSLNIHYLLNLCRQSPEALTRVSKEKLLLSIRQNAALLEGEIIADFLANTKIHRDRTVAHLDRKYVNDPQQILATPPVDMWLVESVFDLLLRIVNTFKGYLDSSELCLSHVEQSVQEDLDYLLSLAEEANARPCKGQRQRPIPGRRFYSNDDMGIAPATDQSIPHS